jgi:phosphoglycolate phosphatase
MTAAIDFIVFDWDGTLFDSAGVIVDSLQKTAADLKFDIPSYARASQSVGMGLQNALLHAIPQANTSHLPDLLARYRHHYLGRDGEVTLFNGAPEMLARLHNQKRRLGIATNKSRVGLTRSLENSIVKGYFETTRCADDGYPKPHPWMLDDIAEETGVATKNILMIGDTIQDMQFAKAAGAQFIGVSFSGPAHNQMTSYPEVPCAESIQELGSWLGV